jgi:acyl-CoA synthetase (NDP forming)
MSGTTMDAISRLIRPRSIAIVGASADPSKTSGRPMAYLAKHGYDGHIYPVNPKVDRIGPWTCYPDIAALPQVPDVAMVLLGAERTEQAVRELAAKGCAAAIVLASGFAETGSEGAARQQALVAAAGPMRLLGPNTIGLVNLTDGIVLSPSGALDMPEFPQGSIAVVSQSGGILGSMLSRAAARGIGLSKLISTSNEVDLGLADFVEHLADDPATRVIALYIESVRQPRRFAAACLKAARAGKPVVAFKVGRSEAGARAAVSHTGAMAGSDRMYDAYFERLGVLRVHHFSDLLDVSAALATQRPLRGRRLAILTSTGGAGTLVSDELGLAGFETPPPDEATSNALRSLNSGPEAVLDRNPIDVTLAGLRPDLLQGAVKALLDSPSYDGLIVIVGSSGLSQPELMAGALQAHLHLTDKPVMAYISPHAPEVARLLMRRGVPSFFAAEGMACSFSALAHWAQRAAANPAKPPQRPVHTPAVTQGPLDEAQAKAWFAQYGIAPTREVVVSDAGAAAQAIEPLGGRAVLKLLSSEITHKSEVGGVAVGVTAADIEARMDQMRHDVRHHTGTTPQRFLVQEMIGSGVEVILGVHRDALGTAVLLGMGGVSAELIQDSCLQMLPEQGGLNEDQALAMVHQLKTWPVLNGYRGRPQADVPALVQAIVAFSVLADHWRGHLLTAEINPLFVLPLGQGVRSADAVAVFESKRD